MPPFARMSLDLLESLARERLGADPARIAEDLDRLESLAPDLAADKSFPEDWIIYRITGQQRKVQRPALISGATLLSDLSALSERLSQQARLPLTADAIELKTLAARWNVNKKTIDRYRRQGLLARRLIAPDGRPRLCFTPAAIMRFEEFRQSQLVTAGAFERIDEYTKNNIIRWSSIYRRRLGWSLNKAAGRIAERTGRSREAIRGVLQAHQRYELRTQRALTFAEPAPLTLIQQKVILRTMIRGADPADLARHYKKPLGSIQRAWGIARANQLRSLSLPGSPREKARDVPQILTAAPVNSGLTLQAQTDLAAFIAEARRPSVPIGVEETSRLAAYRELVIQAATIIAHLDRNFPRSSEIDEAFTNLRWAARLKALLVQAQFRLLIQNLEAGLQTELSVFRTASLRRLLQEAIHAAADAIDSHAFIQATSRGRLAAPIALAINRLAARWQKEHAAELHDPHASRAATRLLPGTHFPDWARNIASWQSVVEPDARLRSAKISDRDLLVMRFGWADQPPRTLTQCAEILKVSSIKIARLERAALRNAYAAVCPREQA